MAWRIVQQPNGLYACFSDIVDNFTDYNMTIEEATELCIGEYRMSPDEAKRKVMRAVEAGLARWFDALQTIAIVHGEQEMNDCVVFGFSARTASEKSDE